MVTIIIILCAIVDKICFLYRNWSPQVIFATITLLTAQVRSHLRGLAMELNTKCSLLSQHRGKSRTLRRLQSAADLLVNCGSSRAVIGLGNFAFVLKRIIIHGHSVPLPSTELSFATIGYFGFYCDRWIPPAGVQTQRGNCESHIEAQHANPENCEQISNLIYHKTTCGVRAVCPVIANATPKSMNYQWNFWKLCQQHKSLSE